MALRAIHEVAAPAKLNLFLHVVGRRADGYHLLQSLFVLIDWCDSLHFESRSDGRISRHDLTAELPADDLCMKAARALQAASGSAMGVDISIAKTLPSGAGMGGGSSDAASTLLALNRLWALHWPRSRLAALALALGADVPFFLGGRNAFVEGIGERITPLAVPPSWFAVVKPAAGVETRQVFQSPLLVRDSEAVTLESFCAEVFSVRQIGHFGRNDLQAAAEALCPQVSEAAVWLEGRFGPSRMTGSGSAVFARAEAPASEAGFEAGAEPPTIPEPLPAGWSGRICRSLAQHPLVDWAED